MFRFIAVVLLLFCPFSYAQKHITVGTTCSLPPYITDSVTDSGLELDIIKAAFAQQGVTVHFKYVRTPFLIKELKDRTVDAILLLTSMTVDHEHFDSEDISEFLNVAIALKSKNYQIKTVEDLAGKRIAAFLGANRYLGAEYQQAISNTNTPYVENRTPTTLVKLLAGMRYDIVIAEQRMFNYWFKEAVQENRMPIPRQLADLDYFEIFPPVPRVLKFNSPGLRDVFDRGLASVDVDKIQRKYQ